MMRHPGGTRRLLTTAYVVMMNFSNGEIVSAQLAPPQRKNEPSLFIV